MRLQTLHDLRSGSVYYLSRYGLGDVICLVSTLRALARSGRECYFRDLDGILELYEDDLVKPESKALPSCPRIDVFPIWRRHKCKWKSPDLNYLGTYYAHFGIEFSDGPQLEMPPLERLVQEPYIVIQERSRYAKNPKPEIVERIVAEVGKRLPWPIVAVGNIRTSAIQGVDYSYCPMNAQTMLALVGHASLVLSPRSASAIMAAGYGKPAFIWAPSDGLNWALNFPGWIFRKWLYENQRVNIANAIALFLDGLALS